MESYNNSIRFQDCTDDIRGVHVNPADLDQCDQPDQNDLDHCDQLNQNDLDHFMQFFIFKLLFILLFYCLFFYYVYYVIIGLIRINVTSLL